MPTEQQKLASRLLQSLAQRCNAAAEEVAHGTYKKAFQVFPEDQPGQGPAVEPPKKEAGAQPPPPPGGPQGGPPPQEGAPQGAPPPPPPPGGPQGGPPQGEQGPDPMQMLQEAMNRTDQLLQMMQELGQSHSALQNEVEGLKRATAQLGQGYEMIRTALEGPTPVTGVTDPQQQQVPLEAAGQAPIG